MRLIVMIAKTQVIWWTGIFVFVDTVLKKKYRLGFSSFHLCSLLSALLKTSVCDYSMSRILLAVFRAVWRLFNKQYIILVCWFYEIVLHMQLCIGLETCKACTVKSCVQYALVYNTQGDFSLLTTGKITVHLYNNTHRLLIKSREEVNLLFVTFNLNWW